MKIEDALEYAQMFKGAITHGDSWGLGTGGGVIYKGNTMDIQMNIFPEHSKKFMLLLLNTFLDAHNSLSKSPNEGESLAAEKLRKMLAENAKERSHSFVQQWLDQHENDEKRLIDFGPTNKESKVDSPEESEEDVAQIIINIGELNINFPTEDPKGFLTAVATPKNDPTEDDDKPSEEDMCDVVLEKCGNNSLLFAEQVNALLMDKTPFSIVAKLVTFLPSIIGNVPKREAEKFKQQAECTGAKVSIYELGTYNRVHPVHLHR